MSDRAINAALVLIERWCGATRSDICEGRGVAVAEAREWFVHLLRENTHMSYPEISGAMKKDEHSTAMTAHKRLLYKMLDDQFAAMVKDRVDQHRCAMVRALKELKISNRRQENRERAKQPAGEDHGGAPREWATNIGGDPAARANDKVSDPRARKSRAGRSRTANRN